MSTLEYFIFKLSRTNKRLIAICVDILLCILATWLAFAIRLGELIEIKFEFALPTTLSILIALPLLIAFGAYQSVNRYASWSSVMLIGRAIFLYFLIFSIVATGFGLPGTPGTVGLIQPLLLFFMLAGWRLTARHWFDRWVSIRSRGKGLVSKVVIYGAGTAGGQIAEALAYDRSIQIIGYLDDDRKLQGRLRNSLPIFGPHEIADLIASKGVSHVLLALPSISRSRRKDIIDSLSHHPLTIRTIPPISDLIDGSVCVNDIKDLDINDLLGRESVHPNLNLLDGSIRGKTVLVTGAGGSIGSELSRQVLGLKPKYLLLIEISEYSLYCIYSELTMQLGCEQGGVDTEVVPLLASVQNESRIREILATWKPDTIYHAAAYKHVPIVEQNVVEGVRNNVFGTLNMAELALESKVRDFVLVSTDKAVRPTNVMGASKRLAELCLQALFERSKLENGKRAAGEEAIGKPVTIFSMVRFGNVLDSSGSVIPKFREQIRTGGPVTVTHPEITRYFMTLVEASQLVIQAGGMAKGGEVFVLDMGEPVRILDLARNMINLSGLSVKDGQNSEGDIEIVITGLRPAEKLYEELLLGVDPQPTDHPKITRASDRFMSWDGLKIHLNKLQLLLSQGDVEETVSLLKTVVEEYSTSSCIVDWVYLRRSENFNGADAQK